MKFKPCCFLPRIFDINTDEEAHMKAEQLINQCLVHALEPTIINTSDSPHYLIGAEDEEGNFFSLNNDNDEPMVMQSLEQAKLALKKQGLDRATFEMHTAYDEMIGAMECRPAKIAISF